MRDDTPADSEVEYRLTVLKSTIDRGYDEGGYKWPKSGIQATLTGRASSHEAVQVDDPRIQAALKSWAESGHIEFIGEEGEEEVYLRVLKPFYLD